MAGIYIHIPFCKSRCRYCDFFSTTQLERREDYAHAIIAEFIDRQPELNEPIRTIYFGGGTPSQMPVESLQMMLQCLVDARRARYRMARSRLPSRLIRVISRLSELRPGEQWASTA